MELLFIMIFNMHMFVQLFHDALYYSGTGLKVKFCFPLNCIRFCIQISNFVFNPFLMVREKRS